MRRTENPKMVVRLHPAPQMVNKIVKYVQEKLPDVVVVESHSTNSHYLKYSDEGKVVRVSDHFGNIKDNVDLNVIVPENPNNFIVVIGFKTFIYTSFQKTAELIVTYLIIEKEVLNKDLIKIRNQSQVIVDLQQRVNTLVEEKAKLQTLNTQLQNLNKNLSSTKKEIEYKKKVDNQTSEIARLRNKEAELEGIIAQKEEAIQEAVSLIQELSTNPELREMLYDGNAGKKYYIDNFPKEMQEMIKEIIKDYYDKK